MSCERDILKNLLGDDKETSPDVVDHLLATAWPILPRGLSAMRERVSFEGQVYFELPTESPNDERPHTYDEEYPRL